MKVQFDDLAVLILNAASEEAQRYNHAYLTPEHVLFCAIHFHVVEGALEMLGVDLADFEEEVHRYLSYITEKTKEQPKRSPGFDKFLEFSYEHMQKNHASKITVKNILCALIDVEDAQSTRFFKSRNITQQKLTEIMDDKSFGEYLRKKHEDEVNNPFDDSEAGAGDEGSEDEFFPQFYGSSQHEDEEGILKKYTVNLTEKAKRDEFASFVGQEAAVHNVFEVLVRRQKNNALLVGESGVGKTALVREVARRIAAGAVPGVLSEFSVIELNVVALVAGTRYRGDFEDRVRRLVSIIAEKKCIVFIDELQTILGVGASSGNSNDFADLIKPLLADSGIRFIGAVTYDEYKKLEREKALLRRFYVVEVPEPTKEDTVQILRRIKPLYEKFYDMTYSDDILRTVVNLSDDFLRERRFPDKAIDVLDSVGAMLSVKAFEGARRRQLEKDGGTEADAQFCAEVAGVQAGVQTGCASTENTNEKTAGKKLAALKARKKKIGFITEKHIEELIGKMTKQPVSRVTTNEFVRLMNAETKLNKKIFGQEHAVASMLRTIRRAKTGVTERAKPLVSALFVGPTGVGKTELSKQLASELGMHFHRFDMSEYQEKHSVSKFIGSPPGYVGHEQGGVFVDRVRRDPYSVVLLDEIEKAHPDVFNLLLQVMDYGVITDSVGSKADFRNTVLIMTSNAGAQESAKAGIGFEYEQHKGNSEITRAVNNLFSPEFRNRLDEVVVFNPLHQKHVQAIVQKELEAIRAGLEKKGIELDWDKQVVAHLARKGYSALYGARNVIRTIDTEVRDLIAEKVVRLLSKRAEASPQKTAAKNAAAKNTATQPLSRMHLCMHGSSVAVAGNSATAAAAASAAAMPKVPELQP